MRVTLQPGDRVTTPLGRLARLNRFLTDGSALFVYDDDQVLRDPLVKYAGPDGFTLTPSNLWLVKPVEALRAGR